MNGDGQGTALERLLAPSEQPYYGPLEDPSPMSRDIAITGSVNPITARRFAAQNGRYLSGLGAMKQQKKHAPVEPDEYAEVFDLEEQDDVLGSGIFDPSNRPATANIDTGIFASQYSLPGYDARSIPFTVQQDITDLTSNASIVFVPGGGMAYVESKGNLIGPAALGPVPPHPGLYPPPPGGRMQSYVNLTPCPPGEGPIPGWTADSMLDKVDGNVGKPTAALQPTAIAMKPGAPGMGKQVPAAQLAPELGVPKLLVTPNEQASYTSKALGVPAGGPGVAFGQARPASAVRQLAMSNQPGYPYPQANYPFPPAHPARRSWYETRQLPTVPATTPVPTTPAMGPVPQKPYMYPMSWEPGIAIGQTNGNNTTTSGVGIAGYVVGGLALGAALAMFMGKR